MDWRDLEGCKERYWEMKIDRVIYREEKNRDYDCI